MGESGQRVDHVPDDGSDRTEHPRLSSPAVVSSAAQPAPSSSTNYLTALLDRVKDYNPSLAVDLGRHINDITSGREFGLVFDRHIPETVALPGRKVRRFDKVRLHESSDKTGWLVKKIHGKGLERRADLACLSGPTHTTTVLVSDLVVVADFRDPIYPGLRSTGRIERGGDKPFHTVINGENYHALEALRFAYEGKVDAIYIDPPYNTGARDWKYNNDYVDANDSYRHSKWLSMMERRLKQAKKLLNPDNSVLIVTIDEKEYLRLGLLLEQVFSGRDIQMVSSVINPSGSSRQGRFGRADEYMFFVFMGGAVVTPWNTDMLRDVAPSASQKVRWNGLIRNGEGSKRSRIPSLFYPIFIHTKTGAFHSVGEPLARDAAANSVVCPNGTIAILPIDGSGQEMMWRLHPPTLRTFLEKGYAKLGKRDPETGMRSPQYLQRGTVAKLEAGDIEILGKDEEGALELRFREGAKTYSPLTMWNRVSHSAAEHGSAILKALIPGRKFPYPKSLYAVEDTLRFFVKDKPDAVVLDFFAGSGTTAHAVMRLNRQDGGHRRSIVVTNNEVSADEQKMLRQAGHHPGEPAWEALGICEHITKPRIAAAITGRTPEGDVIKGDYKFTDEFPMSEGFTENVEFFDLTYEDAEHIKLDRAFAAVAPMLWLRAGAQGPTIDRRSETFSVVDRYGVLFNPDHWKEFVDALSEAKDLRCVFVVTDDDGLYQGVATKVPQNVEKVRLYEGYLRTFELNTGKE